MLYVGDFPLGGKVVIPWATNDQTGAAVTRSTDGTLRIYKDGGSTERTSLSGVTQTEDFDSTTGLHMVVIDLADNADAGFYAAGHEYSVVMAGMVIDTKTVSAPIGHFSIDRASILSNLTTILGRLGNPSGGSLAIDIGNIPAALGGRVAESQGNYTYDQILRLALAILAGVTTNGGTTFKTPNGVATRASANVDGSSNRTSMTLSP